MIKCYGLWQFASDIVIGCFQCSVFEFYRKHLLGQGLGRTEEGKPPKKSSQKRRVRPRNTKKSVVERRKEGPKWAPACWKWPYTRKRNGNRSPSWQARMQKMHWALRLYDLSWFISGEECNDLLLFCAEDRLSGTIKKSTLGYHFQVGLPQNRWPFIFDFRAILFSNDSF